MEPDSGRVAETAHRESPECQLGRKVEEQDEIRDAIDDNAQATPCRKPRHEQKQHPKCRHAERRHHGPDHPERGVGEVKTHDGSEDMGLIGSLDREAEQVWHGRGWREPV